MSWKPIAEAPARKEFIAANAENPKWPPTLVKRYKPRSESEAGHEFIGRNGNLYSGFTHFLELPPLPRP